MPRASTHSRAASLGLALVALATVTLVASQAQPPAQPAQPTFRAGTTLIEVSAIVTRDGQPVTDLEAHEVTVRDNGKPQPLVAFEFVDLTTKADRVEHRRDFVIVLDDLGIEPRLTRATKDVALALIDGLGPFDRLAIVNTGPHELVQQLSTDREASRRLLGRLRGQKGSNPSVSLYKTCHDTVVKLRVVSNAARVMGEGPLERRTILVISEGRTIYNVNPASGPDECPEVRAAYDDVVATAALTNTAVYGIDPRGLQGSSPTIVTGAERDIVAAAAMTLQSAGDAHIERYYGSLGLMATSTGGTLTTDRNNLSVDVPTMIRDSRQYYRLVYLQPDVAEDDLNKPRRIDVTVTRRDVDVRARQQYIAR